MATSHSRIVNDSTRIKRLQFNLLGSDEIIRQSVVEVSETGLYEKNMPKSGGLNDLRMGSVHHTLKCETCLHDVDRCNGHCGHLNLSYPVYHMGYISSILKVLRLVCCFCSALLIVDSGSMESDRNRIQQLIGHLRGYRRLQTLSTTTRISKECSWCTRIQPEYKVSGTKIIRSWIRHDKQLNIKEESTFLSEEESYWCRAPMLPAEVKTILEGIVEKDAKLIGFERPTRPDYMVMDVLLIPPPIIRPTILMSESGRAKGQDDLTRKLQEIVKANSALKEKIDALQDIRDLYEEGTIALIDRLQYHVATYFNNDIRGVKKDRQRSGAPTRCITSRIKGKGGRVRGNVVAKRSDFSARSVITPDSVMDLDEVGVPKSIAHTLTIPERVTALNIRQIYEMIRRREIASVRYPNGYVLTTSFCSLDRLRKIRINPGVVVHRSLRNGDMVTLNRQPSLHKKSIMGHRVRIMDRGNSIRLNLSCVTPYNADFDGDEMNLMVPQNIQGRSELKTLMNVTWQLLDAQNSRPAIGLVQDALVGSYLLTRKDTFLTREDVMNLMMQIHYPITSFTKHNSLPVPAIILPRPLWTGKQMFSLLFPPTLFLRKLIRNSSSDTSIIDIDERRILIQNGELVCGCLSKEILGTTSNGLVDILCKDFGNETASHFLSDCQRVVNDYLSWRGFSVGISDCLIGSKADSQVGHIVNQCIEHTGYLQKTLHKQDVSIREGAIMRVVSKAFEHIGSISLQGVSKLQYQENALLNMVTAGSKGNPVDIAQISACVGQQSINGKRVEKVSGRTFSFYPHYIDHPYARGFVTNSYVSGLSPEEMYYHLMAAREGLVAVAVRTATTGYLQRRITKASEAIKVAYDMSLRDAQQKIIDFQYGRDSMDASLLEKVQLRWLLDGDERFEANVTFSEKKLESLGWIAYRSILEDEYSYLHELRGLVRETKTGFLHNELETQVLIPINVRRLLEKKRLEHKTHDSICTPPSCMWHVQQLVTTIQNGLSVQSSVFLVSHICYELTSKNIEQFSLSEKMVCELCDEIKRRVFHARISPCEMVGHLAAESISEPATQLTLDSFHSCGQASKNIHTSSGVPRLKELIEVTKNLRVPSITAPFSTCVTSDNVETLASSLSICYLKHVVAKTEVLSSRKDQEKYGLKDRQIIELDEAFRNASTHKKRQSKFVIRFELNRLKLIERSLTCFQVAEAVERWGDEDPTSKLFVECSDPNMERWVLRVFVLHKDSMYQVRDFCSSMINHVCLGGIPAIRRTAIQKVIQSRENTKTGAIEKEERYMVITEGSDLRTLLKVEFLDWKYMYTNDIHEILEVLGLEAAIAVLFKEIKDVLTFGGTTVDDRHVETICNIMTFRGYLMPLTRHGINRVDNGVMARASFEENKEMFELAGFGETDYLQGPIEQIAVGRPPTVGSGGVDIMIPDSHKEDGNENEEDEDDIIIFASGNASEEINGNSWAEMSASPNIYEEMDIDPYDDMIYQLKPVRNYTDSILDAFPAPDTTVRNISQRNSSNNSLRVPEGEVFYQNTSANRQRVESSTWISRAQTSDEKFWGNRQERNNVLHPYRPSTPIEIDSFAYRPSTPILIDDNDGIFVF